MPLAVLFLISYNNELLDIAKLTELNKAILLLLIFLIIAKDVPLALTR